MTKEEKKAIIVSMIRKMTPLEFEFLISNLDENEFSQKDVDYFNSIYAMKNQIIKNTNINDKKIINRIYSEEISKLNLLIEDEAIIKRLKGLRIMLFGKTGTGKTTIVEEFVDKNNIKKIEMRASEMIDYKMGQTQVNLFRKSLEINEYSEKIILFIDELDSLVMNRINKNDSAEHSRIIATFIKFLDDLNDNVIVFAATNAMENIDKAVLRRFDIKIEGKLFDFDSFLRYLDTEVENDLSTYEKNLLKIGLIDKKFTLSDLNNFENHVFIQSKLIGRKSFFYFIVEYFKYDINIKNMKLTNKKKETIKGIEGLNYE